MYEFVKAPKSEIDRAGIRQSLAAARPDKRVEAIKDEGDHWLVRLVAADAPPFVKKEEDASSDDAPKDEDEPKDEAKDDDADDDKEEGEDKGDSKDDGEGDALGKLKTLVQEIQGLFDELVNSSGEVTQKADEKDKALQDAHETIKQHLPGDSAPGAEEIGPVPGGPELEGLDGPKPPKAAPVPGGKKKRPGLAPGGVSTFTHRRTFVATHEGVDENGERISMVAAAAQLESDPQFENYEVVGIKEEDGKYVAKLELRRED